MDKICEALKGINVTLSSADLAEIGRYWYLKSIVDNIFCTIGWVMTLLLIGGSVYLCMKLYLKNRPRN